MQEPLLHQQKTVFTMGENPRCLGCLASNYLDGFCDALKNVPHGLPCKACRIKRVECNLEGWAIVPAPSVLQPSSHRLNPSLQTPSDTSRSISFSSQNHAPSNDSPATSLGLTPPRSELSFPETFPGKVHTPIIGPTQDHHHIGAYPSFTQTSFIQGQSAGQSNILPETINPAQLYLSQDAPSNSYFQAPQPWPSTFASSANAFPRNAQETSPFNGLNSFVPFVPSHNIYSSQLEYGADTSNPMQAAPQATPSYAPEIFQGQSQPVAEPASFASNSQVITDSLDSELYLGIAYNLLMYKYRRSQFGCKLACCPDKSTPRTAAEMEAHIKKDHHWWCKLYSQMFLNVVARGLTFEEWNELWLMKQRFETRYGSDTSITDKLKRNGVLVRSSGCITSSTEDETRKALEDAELNIKNKASGTFTVDEDGNKASGYGQPLAAALEIPDVMKQQVLQGRKRRADEAGFSMALGRQAYGMVPVDHGWQGMMADQNAPEHGASLGELGNEGVMANQNAPESGNS